MKRNIIFAWILFSSLCQVCCVQTTSERIRKVQWLVGTWENTTNRGSIFESWNQINDYELRAKSYMLKQQDTIFFETVRIVEEKGILYYIPTVMDQNDQQPVRFQLVSLTDQEMVFENQAHDFPQRILYRSIHSDSLVAEISGVQDGKQRTSRFPMRRVR